MGQFFTFILSLILIIVVVSILGFLINPKKFIGGLLLMILLLFSMATPFFPFIVLVVLGVVVIKMGG